MALHQGDLVIAAEQLVESVNFRNVDKFCGEKWYLVGKSG